MHVLVEVERRDHHDGKRIDHVRTRQFARRVDAIHARHSDIQQTHVGPQLAREANGFDTVGRLGDDLHVLLGVEDHAQSCAHDLLVVGDEHPDHLATPELGSRASTTQPPAAAGPADSVPPRRVARSVMPTIP